MTLQYNGFDIRDHLRDPGSNPWDNGYRLLNLRDIGRALGYKSDGGCLTREVRRSKVVKLELGQDYYELPVGGTSTRRSIWITAGGLRKLAWRRTNLEPFVSWFTLTQLRYLLGNPERWTRNTLARNLEGEAVSPLDESACGWCLSGALIYLRAATPSELMRTVGGAGPTFNDTHTHRQVIKALVEALEDTKVRELG